jgi:hypothetical protein
MRRATALSVYALAAACWLAGGPGGVTLDALLACRHHQAHHTHAGHAGTPSNGPCFCSEMTGGLDVAVSVALPAPLATQLVVTVARRVAAHPSPFSLPPSPSFAPESPPPNALA